MVTANMMIANAKEVLLLGDATNDDDDGDEGNYDHQGNHDHHH